MSAALRIGDIVTRPNGKRATVWKVRGDSVTVVWSAARSNRQQAFPASALTVVPALCDPSPSDGWCYEHSHRVEQLQP